MSEFEWLLYVLIAFGVVGGLVDAEPWKALPEESIWLITVKILWIAAIWPIAITFVVVKRLYSHPE